MILTIIIVAVLILLLIYKKKDALLFVPFVVLFFNTVPFFLFGREMVFDGSNTSVTFYYTVVLFSLIVIFLNLNDINLFSDLKSLRNNVYIFIVLLFVSTFFSTDLWYTLKIVIAFSTVVLSFLSGLLYFRNYPDKIFVFLRYCYIVLILYLLNVLYCSALGLGNSASYLESISFIYLGQLWFFELYPISYLLILIPFFFLKNKNKVIPMIVLVIGLIIFILVGKRTYLYVSIIGLFITYLTYYRNYKVFFPLLIIGTIFYFVFNTSNFISDSFNTIFLERSKGEYQTGGFFNKNPLEEGRFMEYSVYFEEIVLRKPLVNVLLGTELFNSRGKFFNISLLINDFDRVLHSDFTQLLFGAGMIGTLAYLFLLINIWKYYRMKIKTFIIRKVNNKEYLLLKSIFIGMFIALLFNSFSDGILVFHNRLFPFLIMGGILGFLSSEKNNITS